MITLITLILGLVIGFSGGMWYGVHHPEDAAKLSDYEQQKLLELKIKATEEVKARLDQKIADSKSKPVGTSFLSSKPSPEQSLVEVRDEQDKELAQMKQQLSQLKSKK